MAHLPQHPSDSATTKDDISNLNMRFGRMEDRMDKMQRNLLTVAFGT